MEDGADQLAGVTEGEILAGKYRVERVLGIGGMGVVVAARHIDLENRVAIKFLLPSLLGNSEAVARFAREARAAVRIQSEHVARVLDTGTLANGAPYMVMEHLEGGDLSQWLRQAGPLPIEQAVGFVLQACVAVADAHSLGIIHRDVKPENLFCVRRNDGQYIIKVLDFGISKVSPSGGTAGATGTGGPADPSGMSMTRTAVILGSPYYMSPEQVQSLRDVDTRTDIWGLGVVLFELLAGRVPFMAEAFGEMAVKISIEPPPSLRSFRAEVPPALEAVIFKCLEKDRRNRFNNVAELAQALLPFAPARSKASVERISGVLQTPYAPSKTVSLTGSSPHRIDTAGSLRPVAETGAPWSETRPPVAAKKMMLGASGIVLGAAVVVAGLFLLPRTPAPLPQPAQLPQVSAGAQEPAPVTETPPSAPDSVSPGAETLPVVTVAPAPTLEAPATPVPATPAAPSALSATPTVAPTVTHAPPPQRTRLTSPPTTKLNPPDCDPPYTHDAQGRKKFKPECFPNSKP